MVDEETTLADTRATSSPVPHPGIRPVNFPLAGTLALKGAFADCKQLMIRAVDGHLQDPNEVHDPWYAQELLALDSDRVQNPFAFPPSWQFATRP